MAKYLYKLAIERPLVFLCGVGLSNNNELRKKDRRLILKNYIIEKSIVRDESNKIKYQVMPIIVDEIFQDEDVEKQKLSISLLEEIVSAISFKTYIFLDTMSTSYELGLFTNSKSNNDVTLFVDEGYRNRISCPVGDYIIKANKHFFEYPAFYNERAHIFFINDEIPIEISNRIDIDLISIKNRNLNSNIKLTPGLTATHEYCEFSYTSSKNNLMFHFNVKTLFYLLDAIVSNNDIDYLDENNLQLIKNEISNHLFYNYTERSNHLHSELHKYRMPEIDFIISNYNNSDSIIKHVFWLIQLIKSHNRRKDGAIKINSNSAYIYVRTYKFFPDYNKNFERLFSITPADWNIIYDFKINPNYYSKKFTMRIHKKIRRITTYANNQKGRKLKELHNKINDILNELIPTSDCSYAYKKDYSTLSCIEKHIKSQYFYKTDIHKFFDSIKKRLLSNAICEILINKIYLNYQNDTYGINKVDFHKPIAKLLNVCFLNGKLPIGFVTSPKLSDIYLYDIDEKIKYQKGVIVTRYADDYLISGTSDDKYNVLNTVSQLKLLLSQKKLNVNKSKEFQREFVYSGDSIKFLGANLVFNPKDQQNKITISHNYIVETSKLIQKALSKKNRRLREICLGRCNYIKNISIDSYNKLMLIYQKRTRKDFLTDLKKLHI